MKSPRALWYTGENRCEIRTVTLDRRSDDELLLQALASGISRGTESLVFQGKIPDSEYDRMRAPRQQGDFPFPVKYGYSLVGRVLEGPSDLVGKRVFALHPHQSHCLVYREEVTVVDDQIPTDRAVLTAGMETALNALWDAGAGPAERIAVVGAGIIGVLTAYLAHRLPGAEVTLVDVNPERARVAAALGIPFAEPATAPRDCDLVFHASASETGLATSLDLAGLEARVIELSWFGTDMVSVGLGGGFHARRLTLASSQVGTVAPRQRPRWSPARRRAAAMALLRDDRLDAMMDESCCFDDAPDRIPAWLGRGAAPGLCHRLHYI